MAGELISAETALATLGSALGLKVLGPTAELMGNELKSWAERRRENFGRIVDNAAKKLGDGVDEPGAVPPRVLARIIQDGSFCEDSLSVDYLGGVLASSRSGMSRDDRGASLTALVARLSSYELRAHYILYSTLRGLFAGADLHLGNPSHRRTAKTFIPMEVSDIAMDFQPGENPEEIRGFSFWGLYNEYLIGEGWSVGDAEAVRDFAVNAPGPGVVFSPTARGADLFMWAHGKGRRDITEFFDPELTMDFDDADVTIPRGAAKVTDLPPRS